MPSSISHSAWLIVRCQLMLKTSERWRDLVGDDDATFYRACFDHCRRSPLLALLGLIPGRCHLALVENALAKGAPQHYALRKRAIRRQAEECVGEGVAQIVVIGAGFDALAVLMARRHPQLRCFELDTPAMHAHKSAAIRRCYGAAPDNFHAIPADLSRASLTDALSAERAFDHHRPTLVIAEGLTMYLDTAAVEQLFQNMRSICSQPVRVIYTAAASAPKGEAGWGAWLRRATLWLSGEHFYWSPRPEEMDGFLRRQHFTQRYLLPYAELQRPWRGAEEMPVIERQNGEYLVYAVANAA